MVSSNTITTIEPPHDGPRDVEMADGELVFVLEHRKKMNEDYIPAVI